MLFIFIYSGMEQTWCDIFALLFELFPHRWRLVYVEQRPIGGNILYNYNDSAKVRFCCEKCGHGWTSMKGRVAFYFDLTLPGIVTYTLYGQQCQKCESQHYEDSMWYPEEVAKVLTNVRNEIGHIFYGLYFNPKEKMRRPGKPRTPHNSNLCQACKDGICVDK
ncbi:receptor-transporting protein 3-like protein [Dinothrombium tinctorium]|uniref:Receptor-transporting protein 3-like protein n=1 Tax=Dinothrombium tinctorium TaxID=1965070 RepID=A0A443R7P0_9ACAR|nr:receptor-transporting protein 3-like protein [Dinothrombium tinctorium]